CQGVLGVVAPIDASDAIHRSRAATNPDFMTSRGAATMARIPFKRLAQLVAAGAILALAGTAPVASAASPRPIPVFAHFNDTGAVTPSTIPCAGGQAIHGSATFGGQQGDTWSGTASYDFCLKPGPVANTLVYSGTGTFTGSVR